MPTGDQTYIVTGGCGFVGANLVAALQERRPGCHVVVLDSMRTGTFANLVDACDRRGGSFEGQVIGQNIRDVYWPELIDTFTPAAAFHLGAITDTTVENEAEMIEENAGETWSEIMDACADREIPLVYASSAATYGTPPQTEAREPFPENAAGKPNNVYGFSKWLMERAHARYEQRCEAAGNRKPWIVGLRYFNVFGPGEQAKGKMASMAMQLTDQILGGGRPRLFEFGEQARDQVYIDDIVGVTLAGAGIGGRPDPEPGVYNAGSGRVTSFEEVAGAVRRGLGVSDSERPTEFIPMPPAIRRFYQDFTCADMSKAERGLGFKPSCDPAESVSSYARWLADNHG
ncbi:MAG: NAD-dependent epimerase/dehydratase family protein [Phycisphaerales bacterium]|nr:NAD-dependent epimerase/dehydratase family protein [Phycisphaerales bacterium]MCB9836347.1 NAD-dependent epimerase/dehydratase family protein [Phycisphaera sp.]